MYEGVPSSCCREQHVTSFYSILLPWIRRLGVSKCQELIYNVTIKWQIWSYTGSFKTHSDGIRQLGYHYGDIIMGAIASQITSLIIVYSTVYSDAVQRKYQSSASLAFVWGLPRGPINSPHKWPVTRKMFPFGDVIMEITSLSMIKMVINSNYPLSKNSMSFALYFRMTWRSRQCLETKFYCKLLHFVSEYITIQSKFITIMVVYLGHIFVSVWWMIYAEWSKKNIMDFWFQFCLFKVWFATILEF